MTVGIFVLFATVAATAGIAATLAAAVTVAVTRRGAPTPIPGWETRVYGRLVAKPATYARLLDEFAGEWERQFGDAEGKVREALDRVAIHHQDTVYHRGQRVLGATLSPTTIYLDRTNPAALRVLQHELLHVATWVLGGRRATDHGAWTHDQRQFLSGLTKWDRK